MDHSFQKCRTGELPNTETLPSSLPCTETHTHAHAKDFIAPRCESSLWQACWEHVCMLELCMCKSELGGGNTYKLPVVIPTVQVIIAALQADEHTHACDKHFTE